MASPAELMATMQRDRAEFMAALNEVDEARVLEKMVVGQWSIKDVVGHTLDWEIRFLQASRHMCQPDKFSAVPPLGGSEDEDDWNDILVAQREQQSWTALLQELTQVQAEVDAFLADLKREDWQQRGPYPWLEDGDGTVAKIVEVMAEHYTDHIPDLKAT